LPNEEGVCQPAFLRDSACPHGRQGIRLNPKPIFYDPKVLKLRGFQLNDDVGIGVGDGMGIIYKRLFGCSIINLFDVGDGF
jgi:hypothetical protein